MFPFRRNGPKKRGKGGGGGGGGGGGRRHHDNGQGGRRIPGSGNEVLSLMQSSTKALAQMLAGNTRMSGQLQHARSVLAQANRMVDDRMPDRMPPAAREQFFEQLAILRLTITDAEESALAAEERPEPAAKPVVPLDADRLRDVARRLATAETPPPPPPSIPMRDDDEPDLPGGPNDIVSGFSRQPRQEAGEPAAAEVVGTGPRRERLRLKPVQRAVPGSEP